MWTRKCYRNPLYLEIKGENARLSTFQAANLCFKKKDISKRWNNHDSICIYRLFFANLLKGRDGKMSCRGKKCDHHSILTEYISFQNAWNMFMLYPLPKPLQYVIHSKTEAVKMSFFKNRIKGICGASSTLGENIWLKTRHLEFLPAKTGHITEGDAKGQAWTWARTDNRDRTKDKHLSQKAHCQVVFYGKSEPVHT